MPIDAQALRSVVPPPTPDLVVDPTVLQGTVIQGSAVVKGGCVALIALLVVGFCVAGAGGRFSVDLGGLLLVFLIGSVVAIVVGSARQP